MSMIISELSEFMVLDFWGQKFIHKHVQKRKKNASGAQKERSPRLTARRPDKCFAAAEGYLFFMNWLAFVMLS